MTVRELINSCDLVPCEDTTSALLKICNSQQRQIAALKKTLGTFIAWSVRELGQESVKELLGQLEEVES
jgi:hypothetical protein